MTNNIHCNMYYSVTGEPFSITDMNRAGHIASTEVKLNIYTIKKDEAETDIELTTKDINIKTELSIAHDISAEQFFTSETWCMLVDKDNKILKVNNQDIFPISLYRNIDTPQRLKIKFTDIYLEGIPRWEHTPIPGTNKHLV